MSGFALSLPGATLPYVLVAGGALLESPYLPDDFHEPVVSVDTDLPKGYEGWDLVFTSAYDPEISDAENTEGITLQEAE